MTHQEYLRSLFLRIQNLKERIEATDDDSLLANEEKELELLARQLETMTMDSVFTGEDRMTGEVITLPERGDYVQTLSKK